MDSVNCCGKMAEPVSNTEVLWRGRNNGLPEHEAQDLALMGFLCHECRTWFEENDDGKMFCIHIPSGKQAEV